MLDKPPADPTDHHDPAVNAAIARPSAEFAENMPSVVISRVVVGSRRDLSGAPRPALPELVERLARQRLIQSAAR